MAMGMQNRESNICNTSSRKKEIFVGNDRIVRRTVLAKRAVPLNLVIMHAFSYNTQLTMCCNYISLLAK